MRPQGTAVLKASGGMAESNNDFPHEPTISTRLLFCFFPRFGTRPSPADSLFDDHEAEENQRTSLADQRIRKLRGKRNTAIRFLILFRPRTDNPVHG